MGNPTVYLLQEPTNNKDLSSAAQYGRIVPLISAQENPSHDPIDAMNKIAEALKNYDPQQDFLCFAGGDTMAQFLAGIVVERLGIDEVVQLVWNRKRDESGRPTGSGFYVPKRINLIDGDTSNYLQQGEE